MVKIIGFVLQTANMQLKMCYQLLSVVKVRKGPYRYTAFFAKQSMVVYRDDTLFSN